LSIQIAVRDTKAGNSPVSAGLPKQFAEVVLDEIVKSLQEVSLIGRGRIIVNHASWDIISSSKYIFRLLARSIVYLLHMDDVNESIAEDNIQLAKQHLTNKS
jgi:hypothetical protein